MSERLAIVILVAVVVIGGAYIYLRSSAVTPNLLPQQTEMAAFIPHYLFTENDNGTTSPVKIGGTVIVQLPSVFYGKVDVVREDGERIDAHRNEYYNSSVLSFRVPTTTRIVVRASATQEASQFLITVIPY